MLALSPSLSRSLPFTPPSLWLPYNLRKQLLHHLHHGVDLGWDVEKLVTDGAHEKVVNGLLVLPALQLRPHTTHEFLEQLGRVASAALKQLK